MNRLARSLACSVLAAAPTFAPAQQNPPAQLNPAAQQNPPAQPNPAAPRATDAKASAIPAHKGPTDIQSLDLLGGSYQNPLAGIAFRVPGICNQQVAKIGDEIAHFGNEYKTIDLSVSKASSGEPLALTGDARKMGLLEVLAARMKQTNAGVEIVRQDTINLGENQAGIIVARAPVGTQKKLFQQAIIQANDQLYYTFTLISPADQNAKGADFKDPAEQTALTSFNEMLDTVKLLDRGAIKQDQNERLFRTRAFYVTLTEARLKSVLVPEQWLRLMRDNHDMGYTYIVEEEATEGGQRGIKIGIRSRSYPVQTTQVDGETWYFCSFDRKHENWRSIAWLQNLTNKSSDQFTEIGLCDSRVHRLLDPNAPLPLGDKDEKKPPIITSDVYSLEVRKLGKGKAAAPFKQEVAPWYLPQAIGQLLPSLLPPREAKTYMFAVYVSEQNHVMERYVDVGAEQYADLGGDHVRAVPITDRIGLEGSPTVHYVSLEGKYLGSVNKESHITILPSDAATLQKIWENKADLSRPRDLQPGPAAAK